MKLRTNLWNVEVQRVTDHPILPGVRFRYKRCAVLEGGMWAFSLEPSAFSPFTTVVSFPCHSDSGGICALCFEKRKLSALRLSIVICSSVQRSLFPRDDKARCIL